MHSAALVGITLLQLILAHLYFSVLFLPARTSGTNKLLIYVLAGCISFISTISFFPAIITGGISVVFTLLISFLFIARFKIRLFFAILYLILGFIAESVSYYSISFFRTMQGANELSHWENRLFISFISIFVMLLFILILKAVKCENNYDIGKPYYLILIAVILISLLVLHTLFFYSDKNPFYILSVIGILGINILIFFLLERMIEKLRLAEENRLLQKQIYYQENRYEKTSHSFKRIKQIIHDTNKHLRYIQHCINVEKLDEADRHIRQTLNEMNGSYPMVTTGNLVIDALVSHALHTASDIGITFEHDIRIVNTDINIDVYDLCIVLGNIIDNAIEAVHSMPLSHRPFIHIFVASDHANLFIQVLNSRQSSVDYTYKFFTKNPEFHGFGLTNIQKIADKYGGYLKVDAKEAVYETILMLPYKEI
ncbi:GHKL domain-containing protein [Paenibacillus odorifer]|uniref:GHKL domain-containing protein n=1 Tax=Paenibacillus odorifer TaxID=189426 RepID=UPI0020C16A9F|nr:GHKL domain-containing protein [Paenibacillus odorifer]